MTMVNAYSGDDDSIDARTRDLIARRARALGPAYRLFYQRPLEFVRGEGVFLYDRDGEAYLDAYNNVASVGHSHPRVVKAIADQAATLNTHTRYLHEGAINYAERLLEKLGALIDHVMFTCTGSEANDLALRIARAHTGGKGVVVTQNAYHGVTQAVAELSPSLGQYVAIGKHVRVIAAPGSGANAGAEFAAAVRAAFADLKASNVLPAALLVDTIFSSDGVFVDPPGFLVEAAAAAHEVGALFIADEVQPGFARLGSHFWGYKRHGLAPDMVTMGKPMANGHPVAAVAARADMLEAFGETCRYFNTFGGNPVSCAAGTAVLDVIADEGLEANVASTGAKLGAALNDLRQRHDAIGEVRGTGLFYGVDIVGGGGLASRIVNGLRERRVLISATGVNGDVLKIRPPLVFTPANVDQFATTLQAALADL
jgi:4-aminobutyrate aminotransferase-like enzyme